MHNAIGTAIIKYSNRWYHLIKVAVLFKYWQWYKIPKVWWVESLANLADCLRFAKLN